MSMKYTWQQRNKAEHRTLEAIVLVIVIAIVTIAIYTGFSIYTWGIFGKNIDATYNSIHTKAKEAFEMPIKTNDDKANKYRALEALGRATGKSSSECKISVWVAWQQIFGDNKQKVDHCQQLEKHIRIFGGNLSMVVAHLENEQMVAGVMVAASSAKQDASETDWPGIVQAWSIAEAKLEKQHYASSFAPTEKLALGKVQEIKTAWQDIIAANQAKDRGKYETAVAALAQAYGTLNEIGQSAETGLVPLVGRLNQSYVRELN
jgi:hypothetical protein